MSLKDKIDKSFYTKSLDLSEEDLKQMMRKKNLLSHLNF